MNSNDSTAVQDFTTVSNDSESSSSDSTHRPLLQWSPILPVQGSEIPPPRSGAASVVVKGRLYMFGVSASCQCPLSLWRYIFLFAGGLDHLTIISWHPIMVLHFYLFSNFKILTGIRWRDWSIR